MAFGASISLFWCVKINSCENSKVGLVYRPNQMSLLIFTKKRLNFETEERLNSLMLWRRQQLYPLIVQSASGCDLALYKQEVDWLKNVDTKKDNSSWNTSFFFIQSSLHLLLCLVVLKRGIRKQSALHFNHMYFLSLTSAHTESIADWCFHVSTVQQMRAEWPKRKMIIVSQEVRDIWIDDGHQCSTKRDWIQTPNRGKVLIAPM